MTCEYRPAGWATENSGDVVCVKRKLEASVRFALLLRNKTLFFLYVKPVGLIPAHEAIGEVFLLFWRCFVCCFRCL